MIARTVGVDDERRGDVLDSSINRELSRTADIAAYESAS
jgi:hypothetical protein